MNNDNKKIRVLIVDFLPQVREYTANIIRSENDMEVVGFADNGKEAILEYDRLLPDVMTTCINMPIMDGIEASSRIINKHPNAKIIIISIQSEPDYMHRAMLAGVKEFLPKPVEKNELVHIIRKIILGQDLKKEVNQTVIPRIIKKDNIVQESKLSNNELSKGNKRKSDEKISKIVNIGCLVFLGLCILLIWKGNTLLSKEFWFPSTPYPYARECLSTNYVKDNLTIIINRDICVWGIPTSTEVSYSGIWIHFKEDPKAPPYSFFAALAKGDETNWGFYASANNFRDRFVGRCVEIYGRIIDYPGKDSYNQPVIEINNPGDIRYCK